MLCLVIMSCRKAPRQALIFNYQSISPSLCTVPGDILMQTGTANCLLLAATRAIPALRCNHTCCYTTFCGSQLQQGCCAHAPTSATKSTTTVIDSLVKSCGANEQQQQHIVPTISSFMFCSKASRKDLQTGECIKPATIEDVHVCSKALMYMLQRRLRPSPWKNVHVCIPDTRSLQMCPRTMCSHQTWSQVRWTAHTGTWWSSPWLPLDYLLQTQDLSHMQSRCCPSPTVDRNTSVQCLALKAMTDEQLHM